ncbi:MAG: DUF2948 family protein [Rhodobacteraceae bacterium]|nr:DUF2948 family protein [Paracoccaceae bacterium]
MFEDARFGDGVQKPLRLKAENDEDIPVISALSQDAVLLTDQMQWERTGRWFALLLNRFRWEDQSDAKNACQEFERVQAVLAFDSVLSVHRSGFDPNLRDQVVSLLGIAFDPGEDGTGWFVMRFAGDGAIGIKVECIDVTLTDVTRPYRAISGKAPTHLLE